MDIVTLVGALRDWKAKLNPSSRLDTMVDTSGTSTGLEAVEWGSDLDLKDPFEVRWDDVGGSSVLHSWNATLTGL